MGFGSGAASGAATGSAFGPWGTAVGAGVGGLMGWLSGRSRNKQTKEQNARIQERMNLGNQRMGVADQYATGDAARMSNLTPRTDANYDERNRRALDLFGGNTGWERVGFNGNDISNELSGLNSRDVNEGVFDEYANTGGWTPERKRLALEEGTAGARQSTGNVLNEMRRQGAATGNGLAGFLANRASRDFSRGIGDTTTSALNAINNSIDSGRQWGASGRAGLNVGNADRALSAAQSRLQGRMGLADLGLRADLANQDTGLRAQGLDLQRYGMGLGALENLGQQDLNETGMYMSGRNNMFGQGNSIYDSGNRLLTGYSPTTGTIDNIMGGVASAGPLMSMFQDLRNRRTSGSPANNYMIAGGSGIRRGGGMVPG